VAGRQLLLRKFDRFLVDRIILGPSNCRATFFDDDGKERVGEVIHFFGVYMDGNGIRRAGPLLPGELGELIPATRIEGFAGWKVTT